MGPQARALLARAGGAATAAAIAPERLRFAHCAEIDVGFARVRAARMSYVGGPGFELYVPIEMTRHVWTALHAAGDELGLRDAGYYALDALRIEAGRRAWGAELGPDETPVEAGTLFAVQLEKAGGFIGREALLDRASAPAQKRLVHVVLDDADAWAWGGEPLALGHDVVGELTSAGFGWTHRRVVALGYVRGAAAQRAFAGTPAQVLLWGEPAAATLWDTLPAVPPAAAQTPAKR
jgi:glycine cleavage system aminomethyltransferase T